MTVDRDQTRRDAERFIEYAKAVKQQRPSTKFAEVVLALLSELEQAEGWRTFERERADGWQERCEAAEAQCVEANNNTNEGLQWLRDDIAIKAETIAAAEARLAKVQAELDQAEQKAAEHWKNEQWFQRKLYETEARLAKVPALVEALRRMDEHIQINGGCHRGCPEHDALHDAVDAWGET